MRPYVLAVTATLACALAVAPASAAYVTHAFVTGAEQAALEARADQFADPQVFVRQDGAAAVTGAQGIAHAAGLRPALMTDDPVTAAFNAQGKALGFNLGSWFGARGTVVYDPASAKPQVAMGFAGLNPGGVYSVFERRGTPGGATFAPLDGNGARTTFSADAQGNAALQLTLNAPLLPGSALVIVYHSDGTAHGTDPGQPGVTAHAQLMYRLQ
ncbi:MAG: hypothetical protein QOI11_2015 [Candidatus Eremiobacteraeota bacterium]|jgi:hypothetical protein|nr:hypothetical protein [Candidatus Eremiobacteraeota bacterium]